jgi:hypothetical protein
MVSFVYLCANICTILLGMYLLEYSTELSVVQVVQKQELRATFEKYGIVDEVYIAQAGGHAHCSCFSTP